jgi:hypothetical protein
MPTDFDDNGWAVSSVTPLAVGHCYSILAPEPSSMLHAERIRHQAMRFFRLELRLVSEKRYPGGGFPTSDRATFSIAHGSEQRSLEVITLPLDRAPAVRSAATDAAARVGAGLDLLVARAVRLWQIPSEADDPFPLALAAVLASLLLGPIVPPSATTVFGVKTARERLAGLGWRT